MSHHEHYMCHIDEFMQHYIPFAPSKKHVENVGMINKGLQPVWITSDASKSANSRKPCEPLVPGLENQCPAAPRYASNDTDDFKNLFQEHLLGLAHGACQLSAPTGRSKNKLKYYKGPLKSIDGDTLLSCFVYPPARGTVHISDVAIPIQLAPSIRDDCQRFVDRVDCLKSTTVARDVMDADLRRRFMFSLTFAGDVAAIWYHCRSHSILAEIDYAHHPELLPRIFASFLFATPGELGYDPMVTRNEDDGSYTYEIPQANANESKFYRTQQYLCMPHSCCVPGKATRVSVVKEVHPCGTPLKDEPRSYVLKDSWLDYRAQPERDIMGAIFGDIEKVFETPNRFRTPEMQMIYDQLAPLVADGSYKKYFMTIVADYNGIPTQPIAPGAVLAYHLLGTTAIASTTDDVLHESLLRKQYRVVFEEVCNDLDKIMTLGKVFTVLSQVHTALKFLFVAGWVHRDISCGNIMLYEANGTCQAKLSDLEYAKKYPPPKGAFGAADPKTGTAMFIAYEIMAEISIYRGPILEGDSDTDISDSGSESGWQVPTGRADKVVIHNFQHDLESIWWMVLYILIYRSKHTDSHQCADELFGYDSFKSRNKWFLSERANTTLKKIVDPSLTTIARRVERLRLKLLRHYMMREPEGGLEKPEAYAQIMLAFDKFWSDIEKSRDTWNEIELIKRRPGEAVTLKRTNPSSSVVEGSNKSKRARR